MACISLLLFLALRRICRLSSVASFIISTLSFSSPLLPAPAPHIHIYISHDDASFHSIPQGTMTMLCNTSGTCLCLENHAARTTVAVVIRVDDYRDWWCLRFAFTSNHHHSLLSLFAKIQKHMHVPENSLMLMFSTPV
jgi:hypothetical protein